jgi:uncharacterized protein (DUF983 family)
MSHRCPDCQEETKYAMFSGGKEWFCPTCGADGSYEDTDDIPPRVRMLRDGRTEELRVEIRQEIDRRKASG